MYYPFRQRCESFRVAAGGDDLGVSLRIDSKSSECKAKSRIGSAADSIDSADLPSKLVGARDALGSYDVINESPHDAKNHYHIGSGQARAYEGANGGRRDINLSSEQSLGNDWARTDADDFGFQPLPLQ